eukprot:TRINITY_DN7768_c1_g1_i2.p1 TRINITY_DN7768_c1_g1~~TRINITY_DN7768_c1_g1_i2.p1  ORF type:complete len:110 (+),score=15.36 TRINITY_DN7768_c1_g1_i2:1283-1612(+)
MDDEETFSVRATTGASLASPSGPISVRREGSIAVSNEIDLVIDLLRLSISSSFCTLQSLVCNCTSLDELIEEFQISAQHMVFSESSVPGICALLKVGVQVGSSSSDRDR